jgi:tetratricopeptide (TPR) repeat protein
LLKRFFIIWVGLLTGLAGIGSDYLGTLDSLQRELDSANGIEQAEVLYQLAAHTAPWDSLLCRQYINMQYKLIKDSEDSLLWGNYWQNLGDYYYYRDDYINALDYFSRCVDVFDRTGEKIKEGISYFRIILVFFNSGNAEQAMRYLSKMRVLEEDVYDTSMIIASLWGSGYFHNNVTGDYEESKNLLRKAIRMAEVSNFSSAWRGGLIASYALACHRMKQHDSTYLYNRKAIGIFDETTLDGRLMKMQVLYETGSYFYTDGNYDSALFYLDRSLKIATKMTSVFMKSVIHYFMARVYHKQGDLEKAEGQYLESVRNSLKTLETGKAYTNPEYEFVPFHAWDVVLKTMTPRMVKGLVLSRLWSAYHFLSQIEEGKGNYLSSLEWLKKKQEAKQKINEYRKSDELLGIRLKYETEKKDKQITLLSQENELNRLQVSQTRFLLFGLAGMAGLIVIIALLFFRQNRLRSEQKTVLLEQKLLRSQMNPHFLFNALSNISNLIDKNDNATASRFLTHFSRLVRHILESTRTDHNLLAEEIANLENYLALQKLRFDEKFEYHINVSSDVDPEEYTIPPMLIQPFVENAIEHGIKPKEGKGVVEIRMNRQDGMLFCEVEDDGIGRERAMKLQRKEHRSMATSITQERLEALNRKLKRKVSLDITDLKSGTGEPLGTRVWIGIPLLV